MRKTLLIAALATAIGVPAAKAQEFKVQLSPKDPKFNSPACRAMREKAKNYKNGLMDQSAGTYIFAAVAPGGTLGFLALQHRKDEFFRAEVEKACMTNPPDRSYLDRPNAK